jgi:lipopolysaccharide/colanic/teichoic acid biosynthesis glycosyltransferase
LKRLFDIILSLFLLILLSPIFLLLWIFVGLFLGTPVIFIQKRVGYKEKIFNVYKFRSMSNEKDENGNLLPDEKRLGKFGVILRRLSLDELPQFWNVLKGDMSFVGPRPLPETFLPLYSKEQRQRHNVKPGITGWAQINGRNDISYQERFERDIWYVKNQSFLLDMKIVLKTFTYFFNSRGLAHKEDFNGHN